MDVTGALREDHRCIRAQLQLLGGALRVAPEARFVLRGLCLTLSRMLKDHHRKEGWLVGLLEEPFPLVARDIAEWLARDRLEAAAVLHRLDLAFEREEALSAGETAEEVSRLIDRLCSQMQQQEAEVFPVWEWLMSEDGEEPSVAEQRVPSVDRASDALARAFHPMSPQVLGFARG